MSKQWTGYCVVWIVLTLLCSTSRPANAEEMLYVNNSQVNLRSSPKTVADNILITVPKDTPVRVLKQQGTWYNVRLPDGREGWISRWVLTPREAPSGTRGRSLLQNTDERARPPDPTANMVYIPGGTAIMGSDERDIEQVLRKWTVSREALLDELPKETRPIRGFYIDQYEVTNLQYKQFVDATRYPPPSHWKNGKYPEGTGDHPVTFVSWDDAHAYAQWAGKRLPWADEWEAAARGMNGRIFPWGNTYDTQNANVDQPETGTAAVGSHPDDVSAFKVYDLGGNVMEWTLTQYGDTSDFFVLKGSSWTTKRFEARGANKTAGYAEYRLSHIGFRCAMSGSGKE